MGRVVQLTALQNLRCSNLPFNVIVIIIIMGEGDSPKETGGKECLSTANAGQKKRPLLLPLTSKRRQARHTHRCIHELRTLSTDTETSQLHSTLPSLQQQELLSPGLKSEHGCSHSLTSLQTVKPLPLLSTQWVPQLSTTPEEVKVSNEYTHSRCI